jgi:hypothetical protein
VAAWTRRWGLGLAVALAVTWVSPGSASSPPAVDAATLRAAWESHRPALDASARYPLAFDDGFWARVAGGQVGRRRDGLDGSDRVVAAIFVPAPRDRVWVAVQDPHGEIVEGFVDEELPSSTFERRVVYQRITLPWPLAPRQWVIEVRYNTALFASTSGGVWERTWTLSDQRGAPSEDPKAVWLPVNEGGWFLVEAAGGTLIGYHVRTDVGGLVPHEAATRWSFSTLTGLLEGIRDRSLTRVPSHYVGDHPAVRRPDGSPIPVVTP